MQSIFVRNVEVTPLKDNDKNYEAVEQKLSRLWREMIYAPLIMLLGEKSSVLKNANDDGLLEAIRSGRIEFYRGEFKGSFSATISKDLKALGAEWDRRTRTWKLPARSLPYEVRIAISSSVSNFQNKLEAIDRHLGKILPDEVADRLKISEHFDKTLWQTDSELKGSLRKFGLTPTLSENQAKQISDEWQTNIKIPIRDWTQKQVEKLRKDIQQSVYAGNRREALVKIIQGSHQTSLNKAKFIARQETRLLLTKFKETQYQDAGVNIYKWRCANRAHQPKGAPYKKGEVRHDHAILENKFFRWDDDYEVDINGVRVSGGLRKPNGKDNPGQDYNCRCFAIPIVKFKKG